MAFLFLSQWAHLMYSNDIKPWIYIVDLILTLTLNEMEGKNERLKYIIYTFKTNIDFLTYFKDKSVAILLLN